MRRMIRSLTSGLATILAAAALAQGDYTVVVQGQILDCTPSTTVTLQTTPGTVPSQTVTVPVDANCTYQNTFYLDSPTGGFFATLSCGSGTAAVDSGFYAFNNPVDSGWVMIDMMGCGGALDPCQAAFSVQQAMNGNMPIPWEITTTDLSAGTAPIAYEWLMPDGSISTDAEPSFTFSEYGVYGICLTITSDNGNCTSTHCDTIAVDSSGIIFTGPIWIDCEAIINGPNMPGTPCDDGDPDTYYDTWTAGCACAGISCTPPVITGVTNSITACSTDSLPLTATATGTGPLSYTWSGPGWFFPDSTLQTVIVYGAIGGTYHVNVSNACGTVGADVAVTVIPAPFAGNDVDTLICAINGPADLIALLDASPDAGGTWTYSGQPHSDIFDPNTDSPGIYEYTVTGTAPCGSDVSSVHIEPMPIWFADVDGDGYGDLNVSTESCTQPAGYVNNYSDNCPSIPGIIGSPCDDGNPSTSNDQLNANCECVGTAVTMDCLGIPNGPNQPGTSCTDFLGNPGTWSAACICIADPPPCQACFTTTQVAPFTAVFISCSTGGTAPFTYIWDFSDAGAEPGNPITHVYPGPGMYTVCLNIQDAAGNWCNTCDSVIVGADGTINPTAPLPCQAGFWVIQAYDSTATGGVEPILNEVWVWNLSSGGNGSYQFTWDFGDGTTSSDAYPTHEYDGPGPWLLCLTVYSGGCTDTYCDTVSVDENGILNGLMVDGHPADQNHRSNGFTLNVLHSAPTGIAETPAIANLQLWPNPAREELNLTFNNTMTGTVSVTVIDPSGRMVIGEEHNLALGSNTLRLNTASLQPGLYMVRIGNDAHSLTHRFMKIN